MKKKSIKLNFIMNALLSVSNFIFPIITFPYVSRILTPVGTGKIATATSIISYFNIFAQLGIPTYGIRACAIVRDNKEELTRTAHELLMINMIMSAITYVFLFVSIAVFPVLREEKTLYLISSATILLTSVGMEWLYKALEQYTYITVRSVIFKFIAMGLMFLLIHEQKDYVIYGALAIFAASASNILNFINVHKYIDLKPVGKYNMKRHLKPVGIFLAMSCATTIYTNLDTVMLRLMKGDEEVGYYNAAVKIKTVTLSVVTSLGAVLLPRVSYYIENKMMTEFKRVTAKALNFVIILAGGASIYFIFMARECILLVSGEMYEGSIIPMQIIIPTVLIIGISNILGIQMLVPLGKEKTLLWAEIGGAVIDMVINALLIPRFYSAGAAIGTLVAEIYVTIYLAVYLREELHGVVRQIGFIKIFSSLLIACGSMIAANVYGGIRLITWLTERGGKMASFTASVEGNSFIMLALSFTVFSLVYLGMLIFLKERLTIELLSGMKAKIKGILSRWKS